MERNFETHYSHCLTRDMHMLVYGTTGTPLIAFPCQDGKCDNWEGFQMPDTLADFIEEGKIQLFVVDTIDTETFSDKNGDKGHRAWMQEQYYYYIVNEAVPFVMEYNGTGKLPLVTGFSLGASHAAIVFFRRPDLFSGVLSLSGCYDTYYFWDGWSNELLYNNSPVHFLANLPKDHYYVDLYNSKKIIIACGTGNWEDVAINTGNWLKSVCESKGIEAWFDFWGNDIHHDWPYWKMEIRYFLPFLLGE